MYPQHLLGLDYTGDQIEAVLFRDDRRNAAEAVTKDLLPGIEFRLAYFDDDRSGAIGLFRNPTRDFIGQDSCKVAQPNGTRLRQKEEVDELLKETEEARLRQSEVMDFLKQFEGDDQTYRGGVLVLRGSQMMIKEVMGEFFGAWSTEDVHSV